MGVYGPLNSRYVSREVVYSTDSSIKATKCRVPQPALEHWSFQLHSSHKYIHSITIPPNKPIIISLCESENQNTSSLPPEKQDTTFARRKG